MAISWPGDLAVRSLAAVAAGVGVWCSAATLDLSTPVAGAAVRVAMFPPWWTLAAAIAIVLVAFGLSWKILRPLSFSLVFVLPYLPWVPDALPVLRSLAAPGRWIVWLMIAGLAVWNSGWLRKVEGATAPWVFVAGLLVIGLAASRLAGTALFPGGDEPHYLVITQSLLEDHDLKIENNHARGDYAAYFQAPLRPHYLTRGADHEIYSVHPIGLPVLVAPAFALAGYRGVVAFLVLLSAALATLVWWRAVGLTGSPPAATFAWAATCLTAPFLFNSFTVYPEAAAAACVMVAFPWRDASSRTWFVRGLALAALPWLGSKYVAMVAVLVAIDVWRALGPADRLLTKGHPDSQVRRAMLVLLPLCASLAAWFWFFYAIWGSPSPSAPYGGNANTRLATLLAGGPGLWLDQEYGLLAYAPVLLIVFPGLVAMWRAHEARRLAAEITLVFGALLATVGSFHIWWGGSAPPGRPVIAALPLLAMPVAWQYRAAAAHPARRAAQRLLLVGSLGISLTLLLVENGLLLASDRSGSARLLEWLSIGGELPHLVPTFIADPPLTAMAMASLWIAAIVAAAWVIRRLASDRRDVPVRVMSIALAAVLVVSVIVRLTDFAPPSRFALRRGSPKAAAPGVSSAAEGGKATAVKKGATRTAAEATKTGEATRAGSELLDTFDASRRPIGVVYDPMRRVDTLQIPALFPLVARRDLWTTRFSLPAGVYRIDLRPAPGTSPSAGALEMTVGRRRTPIRTWPLRQVWPYPNATAFDLPIDVAFIGFRLVPESPSPFTLLRLIPLAIVDASRRPRTPPVVDAAAFGDTTVFFHDWNGFPESSGFWTKGGATANLSIQTSGSGAALRVRLRAGPTANEVTLRASGWEEVLSLTPGQVRELDIPRPKDAIIPLRIEARTGFVPAQVDRSSTDQRFLGCWLEVVGNR